MKAIVTLHWFGDGLVTLAGIVSVALLVIYAIENNQKPAHYVDYYAVLPAQTHYRAGQSIKFYSFSESQEPTGVRWNEVVYCAGADGVFSTHDTYDTASESYYKSERYPVEIFDILKRDPNGYESAKALRAWARKNGKSPWRLGIDPPPIGSTCIVKHTITVKTKRFRIPLIDVIVSNPWTYGAQK